MTGRNTQRQERRSPLVLFGAPLHQVTEDEALSWFEQHARTGRAGSLLVASASLVRQAYHDGLLRHLFHESDLCLSGSRAIVRFSPLFGPPLPTRFKCGPLHHKLAGICSRNGWSTALLTHPSHPPPPPPRESTPPLCAELAPHPLLLPETGAGTALQEQLATLRPRVLFVMVDLPGLGPWFSVHIKGRTTKLPAGFDSVLPYLIEQAGTAPQPKATLAFCAGFLFRSSLYRMAPDRLPDGHDEPLPLETALRELRANIAPWQPLADPEASHQALQKMAHYIRHHTLILDMLGATWLQSHECGFLVELARQARKNGQHLLLWRPRPRVERLLRDCRAESCMPILKRSAHLFQKLAELHEAWMQAAIERKKNGDYRLRLPTEMGAFNLGRFRQLVRDLLKKHPPAGPYTWTVDGTATEYFDSAALGFLLGLHKDAQLLGGELRLVGLRDDARRFVHIARLDHLIAD